MYTYDIYRYDGIWCKRIARHYEDELGLALHSSIATLFGFHVPLRLLNMVLKSSDLGKANFERGLYYIRYTCVVDVGRDVVIALWCFL